MAWSLVLLPVVAGLAIWALGRRVVPSRRPLVLGTAAVTTLVATLLLAWLAAATAASATHDVGGGLALVVSLTGPAGVVAVLVPAVAAVVLGWAAAHEPADTLPRQLGLLVLFVGAMQLLVVAADLLSLTVAFELVGGLSWALVAHDWHDPRAARAGAHALNATRSGGLGLFLAAGAAHAATGSLAFDDLVTLAGPELHVVAAGVLVAAAAKSAQLPFAPWLFSAMRGPKPVSALLHSSTMVAAGAYALVRLHPVLDRAGWFGPTTIALGLATALAGGVVALLQTDAKRLLAASTSAHHGLMLVAVGAGYPAVAVVHLVLHAVLKSQLFLSAGIAGGAVGSQQLGRMRLGRHLRGTAALTAVGSLALAGAPPLGAAWSKEAVVAAAGHVAPWMAVAVVLAGGLSAAYATRFHLLAFGRGTSAPGPRHLVRRPGTGEQAAVAVLAVAGLLSVGLWVPAVHHAAERLLDGTLPQGPSWELVASVAAVGAGAYAVWIHDRQGRLGHVGTVDRPGAWSDWLGLPEAARRLLVDPVLATATALAAADDRVVDGGVHALARTGRRAAGFLARRGEAAVDGVVEGIAAAGPALARVGVRVSERGLDAAVASAAWLVDRAARDARRTHTGRVHHQFVVVAAGLGLVVLAAMVGR